MIDPNSRYANVETATFEKPDGSQIRYFRRRFCPQGETLPLLVEAPIVEGDRLDLLTARSISDPLQFWRIADANNGLYPFDLMDGIGHSIRVPIPTVGQ